jgi:protein involved in ribonucleotide reduction
MGNNKSTTPIFLAVPFMLFFSAVLPGTSISADEAAGKKEVKEQKNPYANAQISIKIIPSANKTFGYEILLNGKPLVRQLNIPALPGNDGFATKERAQKVADFVVKKIQNNEIPPTVTIEDLNKMGVLK